MQNIPGIIEPGIIGRPAPVDVVSRCRYWDRAATEKRADNDPDATVGLRLSKDRQGVYYIEHVVKMFASPHNVEKAMRHCAQQDGPATVVAYVQDPGSAGISEARAAARALDGFDVRFATATGDKETRAKPVSAQAEAGNIKIVRGPWNDEFLRVLENFPSGRHDDEVDALSGAYERLANSTSGAWTGETAEQMRRDNPQFFGTQTRVQPRVFTPRFQHQAQDLDFWTRRFGRERTPEERGIPRIGPGARG